MSDRVSPPIDDNNWEPTAKDWERRETNLDSQVRCLRSQLRSEAHGHKCQSQNAADLDAKVRLLQTAVMEAFYEGLDVDQSSGPTDDVLWDHSDAKQNIEAGRLDKTEGHDE